MAASPQLGITITLDADQMALVDKACEENTYYRASGGRQCKTCRRGIDKRRYEASKEAA